MNKPSKEELQVMFERVLEIHQIVENWRKSGFKDEDFSDLRGFKGILPDKQLEEMQKLWHEYGELKRMLYKFCYKPFLNWLDGS